jgi:hypothetical protein
MNYGNLNRWYRAEPPPIIFDNSNVSVGLMNLWWQGMPPLIQGDGAPEPVVQVPIISGSLIFNPVRHGSALSGLGTASRRSIR